MCVATCESEGQTRTLLTHIEEVLEDANPYKEHARSRPDSLCLGAPAGASEGVSSLLGDGPASVVPSA